MGVSQYIGARYMPIFADPPEHSTAKTYDPLTIVLHEGNSYTSKQFVPKGIEITNETYWAETGNYNAQVEAYRQETERAYQEAQVANQKADNAQLEINEIKNDVDKLTDFGEFYPIASIKPYSQYAIDSVRYVQGGCIVKDAYCFGAYHSNATNPAYVYLNSMATNANRAINTDNSFGHCNDMTYNAQKNVIIVVGTSVGTDSNWIIYELNADTLQIVDRHVPTVNVWSIAYDAERNCYYGIGSGHIYTFDSNFNVTNLVEISTEQTFQGICYKDDLIYNLNSTSSSIDVFKLDGTLYNKIPVLFRDLVIELQWCDFYNGELFIGCSAIQEPYLCLYRTDIKDKNTTYLNFNNAKTAYVDYDFVGVGNGDSATSPCACISAIEGIPFDNLRISANGETRFKGNNYVLSNRTSLTIVGPSANNPFVFNTKISCYYFDALTLQDCAFDSNLVISHSTGVLVNRGVFNFGEQANPSISADLSSIRCYGCTFNTGYPLNANNSPVMVDTCTFNGDHGLVSNASKVTPNQPFNRIYTANEYAQRFVVPLIRLYKAFIIEVHDGSDNGVTACIGYNKRNATNDIYFNGAMAPGSTNIRTVSGTLLITDDMNVNIQSLNYVKSGVLSNDYYISAIYGIT